MSSILKTFLQNETAIKRYLRRFCVSSSDIEDLAQETFLKAYAAESVETILFPKAFLFRVARNLALNAREKTANATTDSLEEIDDSAVIEDKRVAIEEAVDARQRVRLLAQAVAQLPPQCSRAFLMRKIHGLSYKEIAGRLNISVSTAEKHVALGLLRCDAYLRRSEVPATVSKLARGRLGGARGEGTEG